MKLFLAAIISIASVHSHATIIQQTNSTNIPALCVLCEDQRNGTLAFEQVFTNNTTSALDSLSGSIVQFRSSPSFGGSSRRIAPASFSTQPVVPPSVLTPRPDTILPSPVIPAVPEPETYALMAIGLSGLLIARRKRAKSA